MDRSGSEQLPLTPPHPLQQVQCSTHLPALVLRALQNRVQLCVCERERRGGAGSRDPALGAAITNWIQTVILGLIMVSL